MPDTADGAIPQPRVPTDEECLKSIFSHSPIAIGLHDSEGVLLHANQAWLTLFGVDSVEHVKGLRLCELADAASRFRAALERGEPARFEFAFDLRRMKELHPRETRHLGQLTLDVLVTPVPAGYLFQIVDMTERRQAEQALREEHRRLRSIIEGTGVSTWEWNVQTGEAVFDERWAEIVGYRLNDLAPVSIRTWEGLVHPEDRLRSDALLARHFAGELPHYDCDCRMRHRDGHWVWVHDRGKVITWTAEGQPLLMFGTHTDISERKLLEREQEQLRTALLQAQKLEAIGTLASGVAHDFNNVLGGILSGLSVLELSLAESPQAQSCLQDTKALALRGADLTRQLLGFGRRGRHGVRPLDLALVVTQTATMFGRTRRDLVIDCDLAPDLQAVLVEHAQLERVLLNLLLNAGQAMPDGGRIVLRAENSVLSPDQASLCGAKPGSYVKLTILDTGIGMDAATQARAFEPFFSTKPPAQGSGLGLASVHGIIEKHGGIITLESEPEKGTKLTIWLPSTEQPVVTESTPTPANRLGEGTVLVVDDDVQLLGLLSTMVRSAGYDVLTANGGRQAIAMVREHRDRVSIVLLDLVMPDLNGAATFDALHEIAPELKVLLSSGCAVEGQAEELLARGCNGFIQKPYDVAALTAKLRSLL